LPSSSTGAGRTPSGRLDALDGTPYSTQCTQVPAGASGSSHTSAKLLVPGGGSVQASGGERSSPSQVCLRGIVSPGLKALDLSSKAMAAPPGRAKAAARGARRKRARPPVTAARLVGRDAPVQQAVRVLGALGNLLKFLDFLVDTRG